MKVGHVYTFREGRPLHTASCWCWHSDRPPMLVETVLARLAAREPADTPAQRATRRWRWGR